MEIIDEAKYEALDGYDYFSELDTDMRHPIRIKFKDARQKDKFESIVCDPNNEGYKGDFARFAWEHGVGTQMWSEQGFAAWITDESHYCDGFFYIDDFKGYNDEFGAPRMTRFQLRVSNHPPQHTEWEKRHALEKRFKAQFGLTLLVNPNHVRHFPLSAATAVPVTCIVCDISSYYHGMDEKRKEAIDKFVTEVAQNKSPHVTMAFLNSISDTGEVDIKKTGPIGKRHEDYEENFKVIDNPIRIGKDFKFFEKKPDEQGSNNVAEVIPYSVVDGLPNGTVFEYEGRKYKYVEEDDDIYVLPIMAKRGKEYIGDKHIMLKENRIRITTQDIMEMVINCLKRLIY